MRKDSLLAEKDKIQAEDLWDKPLILSHQTSINSEMALWLKTDFSKLNIAATYDLVYNAAQFAKNGLGYVIALNKLINTTGDSELCFRPLFPTLQAELFILWKKYQVLSRASRAFLQQLQQELNIPPSSIISCTRNGIRTESLSMVSVLSTFIFRCPIGRAVSAPLLCPPYVQVSKRQTSFSGHGSSGHPETPFSPCATALYHTAPRRRSCCWRFAASASS